MSNDDKIFWSIIYFFAFVIGMGVLVYAASSVIMML